MKRFLVFCGEDYYPQGGMNDFVGDFDTLEECRVALKSDIITNQIAQEQNFGVWLARSIEWTQIWDSKERKLIKSDITS